MALSVTLSECLPNASAAIVAIKAQVEEAPKILLGGMALNEADPEPGALGCDAIARNALEAVREARRLVGLTDGALTLEEHLFLLGRRIRTIRGRLNMTQQELGDASGLDRSYISAASEIEQAHPAGG